MAEQQNAEEISLQWIKGQLDNFADLEDRQLTAPAGTGKLLYVKSITDPQIMNRSIIAPFYEMNDPAAYAEYLAHYPGSEAVKDSKQVLDLMLGGYACVEVEQRLIFFDALKAETSSVSQTMTESVTQGPSDALTENLAVNLNLIRRRYQSPELKMESMLIGNISRTKAAILYDDSRVNHQVLDELRERLSTLRVDILQAAGELEKYINSDKVRIFPKTIVTERPDRVVFNLAEGKIAVMLDTTGFAIILPVIFNDFFVAMDDKIQLPFVGRF